MRAKPRLVLSKEVLTQLDTDELAGIAGAAVPTLPAAACAAAQASKVIECTSIFIPCVSHTCTL